MLNQRFAGSGARSDVLFLTSVVALSVGLYVHRLGFYYDDWSILGYLHTAPDQSFFGLIRTAYTFLPNDQNRPLQAPYLGGLYWLFGNAPLPYHLANTVVLGSGISFFYLALRALGIDRAVAVSLPLVYALLPNYSTDRFWFLASVANLTLGYYFAGLYCQARTINTERPHLWQGLSVAALLVCGLIYEMFLPLFLLTPFLVWYAARRMQAPVPRLLPWGIFAINLGLIGALLVFKLLTTDRLSEGVPLVDHLYLIYWLFSEVTVMNYLENGFGLPLAAWRVAQRYPDPLVLLFGVVTGLGAVIYLFRVSRGSDPARRQVKDLLAMGGLGFVVLGLGYVVFAGNYSLTITPTGVGNRTALAGAVGPAVTVVAVIGLAARLARSPGVARFVFAGLVGLMSMTGMLVTNTLATFWIETAAMQREILAGVEAQLPDLPADSTVVLDGFCSYAGPAIVFTIDWDTTGAMMTLYDRRDVRGDVALPYTVVDDATLTIHADYPYANLHIYNFAHDVAVELRSAEDARAYFDRYNPDRSNGCPDWRWGHGVSVF